MVKIKRIKSAVDAAQDQALLVALRDTLVAGFLCKMYPNGTITGAQRSTEIIG